MKKLIVVACLALVATVGLVAWTTAETPSVADNEAKIASLVTRLEGMSPDRVNALEPLEVRRFEVPGASVDVMRARIVEHYAIDGIGEDSVELTGWIAVKHFNARTVDGSAELNWNNAVVDTQFVGMDLRGTSDVFGDVIVKLDPTRPVQGQVGRIQIPELAKTVLLAQLSDQSLTADSGRGNKSGLTTIKEASLIPIDDGGCDERAGSCNIASQFPSAPTSDVPDGACTIIAPEGYQSDETANGVQEAGSMQPAFCAAPVIVAATMPGLGLEMRLAKPAVWYSRVETIPPVGATASVTVEPVDLIADGRVVGQLTSGKVCFREVVSRTELDEVLTTSADRVAAN